MKNDKDFDDIFKKGLGDPDGPAYREEDWNAFAQMLDTPKKKSGLIFWLPVLSAAAILLIAFGWWALRPENAQNSSTKTQVLAAANQQKVKADTIKPAFAARKDVATADKNDTNAIEKKAYLASRKDVSTPDDKDSAGTQIKAGETATRLATRKDVSTADRKETDETQSIAKNANNNKNRHRNKPVRATADLMAANEDNTSILTLTGKRKHRINSSDKKTQPRDESNNTYADNQVAVARDTVNLLAYSSSPALSNTGLIKNIGSFDIQSLAITTKPRLLPVKRVQPVIKPSVGLHPQYALSVIGAPEVNGVGSLSQTSSGTNLGVLFSVELFNKVFISTGGMYSIKPYNSDVVGYGYNSSLTAHNVTSVDANCHVLDIPLNVDYQFYNKHQNMLSVGTGLSSYIMLYEHYQYNYADPEVDGPINKTIQQTNKYLFGVLNLQATYTRQLTYNVGLSLQPYMKLPLTGIGATGARLQTAGLAVGLNWNLK